MAFFFFNDTATTEIYTLSLHDALPISLARGRSCLLKPSRASLKVRGLRTRDQESVPVRRSEEHTSELQSRLHLVCRLLLEKKKKKRSQTQLTSDRIPKGRLRARVLTLP